MNIEEARPIIETREEVTPGGMVVVHRAEDVVCMIDHIWVIESRTLGITKLPKRIVCWVEECGKYIAVPESDHPGFSDCPIRFFAMAPDVQCREWRDWVWSQAEEKLAAEFEGEAI